MFVYGKGIYNNIFKLSLLSTLVMKQWKIVDLFQPVFLFRKNRFLKILSSIIQPDRKYFWSKGGEHFGVMFSDFPKIVSVFQKKENVLSAL